MKREACYATTPFHTPTEGAHLVSTNGSKGPCSLLQGSLGEKEDRPLELDQGQIRGPFCGCTFLLALLLCLLSLEPDAGGAQQPAAAAGTIDVRVWWPRAAKNNYLMQGLGHGWKHPQPTGSSERRNRKDVQLPPLRKGGTHMHSARAISLNSPSVQMIWFCFVYYKQTTGPLSPSQRWCSCEWPCLTTQQKRCQQRQTWSFLC